MAGSGKKTDIKSAAMFMAAELLVYFVLFFTIPAVKPVAGTKLLLALISLFAGFAFARIIKAEEGRLSLYKRKAYVSAIIIVALYASLASFAQRFFFDGYSRMHLSLAGFVCCVLGFIWFVPVICSILWSFEKLSAKCGGEQGKSGKFFIAAFLVYCVWQAIVIMAFRPGGFPPDSISQLFQAIGYERIVNSHPALHTLFLRLIMKLGGNRAVLIIAVQALAFAALTAGFVEMFARWGLKKWIALTGGLIFLMLPANVLNEVSAVKDFPYSLSLLWATLCLCKIAKSFEVGCRVSNLAQLSVACFFIYGFRHNGIVSMLFIIILCLVLTIKFFSAVKFRLVLTALATLIMLVIYKGPVFAAFDVLSVTQSPYTTMLCAVGSCINQGLPMSDEAVEILESAMPLEDWGKYYSRYEGHDQYYWGRGDDAEYKIEEIDGKEAFRVYLEALFKYPDVVIKDRLDGMDIMWDVHCPPDSFNERGFDTIYYIPFSEVFFNIDNMETKGYQQYAIASPLADAYRATKVYSIYSAVDMLTFRTGAHIIFMLAVLIYICAAGKKRLLWAAVPLGGNIFGLLFLLYHQSFRYVYALQPMIIALAVAAVLIKGSETKKENKAL